MINSSSRILAVAFAWATVATPVAVPPLTAIERRVAADVLQKSASHLFRVTDGLSAAQWNFRPGPGRWSIAEIAEHLAVAELSIPSVIGGLLRVPSSAPAERTIADSMIFTVMSDRSGKASAPEILRPTGRFPDRAAFRRTFESARAENLAFVDTTTADLRSRHQAHPVLGPLDGYQWMLFLAAHMERHIAQMEEVRATPGFP